MFTLGDIGTISFLCGMGLLVIGLLLEFVRKDNDNE
jgi:hypothetical protein